ncbi:MAG TPA: YdcF family protein [Crenotrichaceae bacterium]|nr:YdcF family protein [Crenotrichaceae bacterium]
MSVVVTQIKYKEKPSVRWLNTLLGCIVIDIVFTIAFLVWSQYSAVMPDHIEADGAVLLFAGLGNKQANDESQRRLNHAYNLYQNGTVKEILSAGGYRRGSNLSGSAMYQQKLHGMGVPENVLSVEGLSYDTQTNIINALSIIEDKHWKRIVFVSSPTHLMRVKHYLQHRNLEIEVYYSAYDYLQAQPKPGLLALWYRVHSEWAIYLMYNVLDQEYFGRLVRTIRLGPEVTNV